MLLPDKERHPPLVGKLMDRVHSEADRQKVKRTREEDEALKAKAAEVRRLISQTEPTPTTNERS